MDQIVRADNLEMQRGSALRPLRRPRVFCIQDLQPLKIF